MNEDTASLIAALWRACSDEARLLEACARRLERGVARAIIDPPPAARQAAWNDLLAAQRAALDATRARSAMVAVLLNGDAR